MRRKSRGAFAGLLAVVLACAAAYSWRGASQTGRATSTRPSEPRSQPQPVKPPGTGSLLGVGVVGSPPDLPLITGPYTPTPPRGEPGGGGEEIWVGGGGEIYYTPPPVPVRTTGTTYAVGGQIVDRPPTVEEILSGDASSAPNTGAYTLEEKEFATEEEAREYARRYATGLIMY